MTINDQLQNMFYSFEKGQFQDLFFEIMRNRYGDDFEMPKPYGPYGDYSCDGILKSECIYFACYGPENPSDSPKTADGINEKIDSDSKGLINRIKQKKWTIPIRKFIFVVNLKNQMNPPTPCLVHKQDVEQRFYDELGHNVDVVFWTQYDLMRLFSELDKTKQEFIVGKTYVGDDEFDLDGATVARIIEKASTGHLKKVEPHHIMEFRSKIAFNCLSSEKERELLSASFFISSLEKFLDNFTYDASSVLQNLLTNLYQESKSLYPGDQNSQYDYIKQNIYCSDDFVTSNQKRLLNKTITIIMSAFIENCSIFERQIDENNP